MSKKNNFEMLQKYREALNDAKFDNKLTPEGRATLDAIDSGAFTSPRVANLIQGLTFNTGDEILGYLRSAVTPGLSYDDAVLIERGQLEESSTERPVASTVEQLIGTAGNVALTRGAGARGVAGQILPGMAYGGAFGFGASEGTPTERLPDAAVGAAVGGVTAPAVELVSRPLTNVAGSVGRMLRGPKTLANQQARELLKEALENDAQSVEEAVLYVLNKNTTGKPYTLADLGPNSQALLDAVNVLPGPGKGSAQRFLRLRDQGVLGRLSTDLQEAFGSRAAFFDEFKALQTARKTTGDRLYQRAYRKNVRISGDLEKIFSRPAVRSALDRAYNIAAEEGVNLPKFNVGTNGKLIGPQGSVVRTLPTRFLHYVKRGLDDEAFAAKGIASNAGKDYSSAVAGTRRAFLELLDDANPTYRIARNYWSGKSAVMDAMTEGQNFLRANPEELADLVGDFSQSELEGFRLGAMQGILNEIDSGAERTAAQRLVRSPMRQRLLRLTFPQTEEGKVAADKFLNRLNDEIIMRDTSRAVLGGSQTAQRGEFVSRMKEGAARDPATGLTDLVRRSISADFKGLEDAQLREVANQLSSMLTATGEADLQAIQRDLQGKGIKAVLRKHAPSVLPRLTRLIVNPQVAAAGGGTMSSSVGAGDVALELMGRNVP
jgi:hypothetical protein|tara:strand:- start:170 stop:2152 length:1983 start_codon:yes stop_codon:yes gene_type:complete